MGFAWRQANDPNLPAGTKWNGTPCGGTRAFAGRLVLLALTVCLPLPAQPPADWPVRIKSLVDHGHPDQAMAVAEEWMRAYPQDLDARAWHARLLAWSHHWPEAEAEYKSLVELSPEDSDLLMDLAHLLAWQKRYEESLQTVERACMASPGRADCDLERARLLRRLGRTRESRAKYKAMLEKGVAVEESKAALAELTPAASHELRIGGTADLMSYTDNAVPPVPLWQAAGVSAGALSPP